MTTVGTLPRKVTNDGDPSGYVGWSAEDLRNLLDNWRDCSIDTREEMLALRDQFVNECGPACLACCLADHLADAYDRYALELDWLQELVGQGVKPVHGLIARAIGDDSERAYEQTKEIVISIMANRRDLERDEMKAFTLLKEAAFGYFANTQSLAKVASRLELLAAVGA